AVGTLVLTVMLYIVIPKGFFPVQDTGAIQGISEAPPTVSFAAMAERQQALADIVLNDPAVESLSSFIGVEGTNATLNSGRMLINLKPLGKRDASAVEVIRRLQRALADVEGITLYMQPIQDLTIEDRVSRTQYQFTLESANPDELAEWVHRLTARLSELPQLADVASDLQDQGLQAFLSIDRATAGRLGITPAAIDHLGQFPAATISFNLAPGVALGDAVQAIETEAQALGLPPSIRASFQGAALAFRASLANELLLILAAIVTMYIVLGVLYESY